MRLRVAVPALDALREVDLLGGRQQVEAVDLPEEELERVRGDRRKGVVRVGDLLGDLAPAVVLQLDPTGLDLVEHVFDRAVRQIQLLCELSDLGQLDAARLVSVREQRPDALVRPARRRSWLFRRSPGIPISTSLFPRRAVRMPQFVLASGAENGPGGGSCRPPARFALGLTRPD